MNWHSYIHFAGVFLSIFSQSGSITPIEEVFAPKGNYPKSHWVKLAVVQWNTRVDAPVPATAEQAETYKNNNRKVLESYIREAASKGAEIIATPEFGITGYPAGDNFESRDQIEAYVETVPGKTTDFFRKLSAELGVYIHVSYAIVDTKTNNYYNALVVLNPKGDIEVTYKKQNLFPPEPRFLEAGIENMSYMSPAGKVGLMICADCYEPTVVKRYQDQEIDILVVSAAWTQYNRAMEYFRAAGVQIGAYTLGANAAYCPDSGVIAPDGSYQSHIRQSLGVAYGYAPRKTK